MSDSERDTLEKADDDAIEDMFGRELLFGTSGVRGIRGPGISRINRFTVYRYCRAFARIVSSRGGRKALICRDCRIDGDVFLNAACQAFRQEGMEPCVLEGEYAPTPLLSFSDEKGDYDCAVNVTSSHNTMEYSGIKLYGNAGELIPDEDARLIEKTAAEISIPVFLEDAPEKTYVSHEKDYIRTVCSHIKYAHAVKIAFTPLHGVSGELFKKCAERCGIELFTVDSQMEPDGAFPTVKSPNPEDEAAMKLCIETAERYGADLAVALDPDGDRMGAAVRTVHGFKKLNPNAAAALLLDRQIRQSTSLSHAGDTLITTYVSGGLPQALAERRGLQVKITSTGFKNMAAQRRKLEGEGKRMTLAFEESYGYMLPGGPRDKDGINAALSLADAAGELKIKENTNLADELEKLMAEVGYFDERWLSIPLKDRKGVQVFGEISKALSDSFGALNTVSDEKLLTAKVSFEKGVLWVRPSGTEPKIKLYGHGMGASMEEASSNAERAIALGEGTIKKCMGEWA